MSGVPRRLAGSERVTAAAYNALLDFARRCMPLSGSGTSVSRGPYGSTINASGGRQMPAAADFAYGAFRWQKDTGTTGEGDEEQPTGTISMCYFQFGRAVYELSDKTDAAYGATYYLVIPHADPSAATVETSSSGGNSRTQSVVPLFSVNSDGDVSKDYRGMPVVPVYGTETT